MNTISNFFGSGVEIPIFVARVQHFDAKNKTDESDYFESMPPFKPYDLQKNCCHLCKRFL